MTVWVTRVVGDDDKEPKALRDGVCITGWDELPDFRTLPTISDLKAAIKRKHPAKNNSGMAGWAGQISRFRDEMQLDDFVVMPSKLYATLYIGMIKGDYEYTKSHVGKLRHQRRVQWIGTIPKNNVPPTTKSSLGTFLTVFRVEKPELDEKIREIAAKPLRSTFSIFSAPSA